jgi:saccharopine dehydrogenase (NAD+, L-lysine-forming)
LIGVRREDKNDWERRTPLSPDHVSTLVQGGLEVAVQKSPIRVFPDEAYQAVGATLQDDLSGCDVVFGVKEIPKELFAAGRTYVFFTHVIKGQPYNMAMLRRLLDLRCTVICYEKVTDDKGRRLVLFGRHAGWAGMIDTLWALGQRLDSEGIGTPLKRIRQAHNYESFEAALAAIEAVGTTIAAEGLPPAVAPLTVGITGYGNVSAGAQEVLARLPVREVTPDELPAAAASGDGRQIIKVVFKEEHMVVPRAPDGTFELSEYYDHPERYRGTFARHVPHLTALVNCIYWTPSYPRLITRDLLQGLYGAGCTPRLRVIGDISCDIEGGVECTLKPTESGDPVYVYLPEEDRVTSGVAGHGPVVLAVDNLPCELPLNASQDFGDALLPLVDGIARADYQASFDELVLPPPIKRAVITHQGELTPDFVYLMEHLGQ